MSSIGFKNRDTGSWPIQESDDNKSSRRINVPSLKPLLDVSFYKNLSKIPDGIPHIVNLCGAAYPDETVARYMYSGIILTSGTSCYDLVEVAQGLRGPEENLIGTTGIATDREWVWPTQLAHYVWNYGIKLPDPFIAKAYSLTSVKPLNSRSEFDALYKAYTEVVLNPLPPLPQPEFFQ